MFCLFKKVTLNTNRCKKNRILEYTRTIWSSDCILLDLILKIILVTHRNVYFFMKHIIHIIVLVIKENTFFMNFGTTSTSSTGSLIISSSCSSLAVRTFWLIPSSLLQLMANSRHITSMVFLLADSHLLLGEGWVFN